ncbi:adenosine 3-phospho 5-phosphosulfate transporter 1-like [Nannochloropsis oceanica]
MTSNSSSRRRIGGPKNSGINAGSAMLLAALIVAVEASLSTDGSSSSSSSGSSGSSGGMKMGLPGGQGREQTAGMELYLLASNFLLYTALVIVAIMISKLYLEAEPGASPRSRARQYSSHDVLELFAGSRPPSFASSTPVIHLPLGAKRSSILDFAAMSPGLEGWREGGSPGESPGFRTKGEVLRTLVFCSAGLICSFLVWGILQERMLTMPYRDGEFFTYSYGLVFTNRLFSLILSSILVWMYERESLTLSTAPLYEYSFPSVSNMLSSWCQYEALAYVTFPTQTLSKSFKLVPIMLMGRMLTNKQYPLYEYATAISIGLGNTLFMMATENLDLGVDSFGQVEDKSGTWCGVMLLLLFLFFDSFTSQWQSRMFSKHEISPVIMMFYLNAFSTVFSFITLVHTRELTPFFHFISKHPSIHLHFWLFSICSTIGQLFIFLTIKTFGPVVFAIIMSTRILLSIAASCFLYGHPIPPLGYLGLAVVFFSIAYRIKRKTAGQRLVQWEGMDDEEAPYLMKEFHEHLDM